MASTNELIKRGQLAELREKRAELEKKFSRCREDVVTYTFPTNALDPIESCQLDLAAQAMKELLETKAKHRQVSEAIRKLEG